MGGASFEFPVVPPRELLETKGADADRGQQHLGSSVVSTFKSWLGQAASPPWPSTQATIESYLDLVRPSDVTLRANAPGDGSAEWITNVRLSGCAGMAEVSSWLVSHWMELWFRNDRASVDKALAALGFRAGASEPSSMITRETFLPIGVFGYAMFHPGHASSASDDDEDDWGPFQLDGSVDEEDAALAGAIRWFLRTRLTGLMRDGRCRCQICMPEFDLDLLEELPSGQ